MADFLGWLNLVIFLLMGTIYPIKKRMEKKRDQKSIQVYRKARVIHPILGSFIILIGFVHGYMQLGRLRLHTGTLLIGYLLLMGLVAILGPRIRFLRKRWRVIHRSMGIPLVLLLLVHLFYNGLI